MATLIDSEGGRIATATIPENAGPGTCEGCGVHRELRKASGLSPRQWRKQRRALRDAGGAR